jgi:hypothetical protein
MDNLVFEESLNTEVEHSEFINKKWIYVNDNNNGSYAAQVVLDSTALSNSGAYIGWSEAFILMPLVVQLTSATAASLPIASNVADFSWAFKSGFWHMLDSMTVEFNNQNVIQTTPFTNVFRSFKANTTFSIDDIKNHGSSTGFFPDTAGSWAYNATASGTANQYSGRGDNCGISNNANGVLRIISTPATNGSALTSLYAGNDVMGTLLPAGAGTVAAGVSNPNTLAESSYAINLGMKRRQEWIGYSSNISTTVQNALNQISVNSGATAQSLFRPVKTNVVAGNVSWVVYAKLRLKDLADFFEKVPLLKGSTIRFLINTNQSITNFTITAGTISATTGAISTNPILTINSSTITGGRTCPLMIASAGYGSGSCTLPADTYTITCSVFKNNFSAQANQQSATIPCRLYAPAYTMNPLAESKYLSLAPTKRVLYKDIFQYQYTNVGAGQTFNFLASNGINRIRSVLVIPFINTTTAGGIANINTNINSLTTPCSATPAMPDPIMLSNFNILISGMNLFISNTLYDFESFREHLMSANQLNGNLTTGLTSGQISEDDFSRGYRYYFGDCSRALPSEENVSRSVQVIGTNSSLVPCDIMVFVEFMKEITIDLTTGARID